MALEYKDKIAGDNITMSVTAHKDGSASISIWDRYGGDEETPTSAGISLAPEQVKWLIEQLQGKK